MGSSILDRCW